MSSSRVSPDSYHSTLSLGDNHVRVFSSLGHKTFRPTLRASYIHTEIRDRSPGLLHPHRNSGSLPGPLTPIQKFRISPRVSYTLTELRISLGSLTPTQKFRISPRVSYTLTEIQDRSPGLLHPHRNSGFLPGSLTPSQNFGYLPGLLHPHRNSGSLPVSLTPIQKFRISPRVSYTHTEPFGYYRGSPSP